DGRDLRVSRGEVSRARPDRHDSRGARRDTLLAAPHGAPHHGASLQRDPLRAGKTGIVGPRFTVADVILYCALDFGRGVGQPIDPALGNVSGWFERVPGRPSAAASLH